VKFWNPSAKPASPAPMPAKHSSMSCRRRPVRPRQADHASHRGAKYLGWLGAPRWEQPIRYEPTMASRGLECDRLNRCPQRRVIPAMLLNHAHCALADFWRNCVDFVITLLLKGWSLLKTGEIQSEPAAIK
jgi:hypothetical protein